MAIVQERHSHIASSTPRRTRIKVSRKRRNHHEMTRIVEALKKAEGVHVVHMNPNTGSIVVQHQDGVADNIEAIMEDLGVILGSATDVDMHMIDGKARLASDFTEAIADLNQRLGLATNGIVNLRTIVPLGLGAAAVVQLMRKGFQIGSAPWYVLAYAAFDSFIKLHYTRDVSSD